MVKLEGFKAKNKKHELGSTDLKKETEMMKEYQKKKKKNNRISR